MTTLIFNKPYGVLCQFRRDGTRATLADYIDRPGVHPTGRLDADSEGLLVLTDDGRLQHRIAEPRHKLRKTYWAQVEHVPDAVALARLRGGIDLGDFTTQPCEARPIPEPALWPRTPPIRHRAAIPTAWIELTISEGKNRQVRRMTAAVGHPTLRLVRVAIGGLDLMGEGLQPGQWRVIDPARLFAGPKRPARASSAAKNG